MSTAPIGRILLLSVLISTALIFTALTQAMIGLLSQNNEKPDTWGKECEWVRHDGSRVVLPCDQDSRVYYLRRRFIPSVCRRLPPINSPSLVSQLCSLALDNWKGTATQLKEALQYERSPRLLSRELAEIESQLREYSVSLGRGYSGKAKVLSLTVDKTTSP